MDLLPLLAAIKESISDAVVSSDTVNGSLHITVKKEHLTGVANFLKNEARPKFDMLSDVFGVDYPDRKERIEVVYNFYSLESNSRLFLKVRSSLDESGHPSLAGIFKSAVWLEREVYDMLGLKFEGHPDMKRILNPDDWDGHPLLKDYPLRKRPEPEDIKMDTPGFYS